MRRRRSRSARTRERSGIAYRYAKLVVRLRSVVIAAWVFIAYAAFAWLPPLGSGGDKLEVVPALMAVLGPWAFWPSHRRVRGAQPEQARPSRLLTFITGRRPAAVAAALCLAGLRGPCTTRG